MSGLGGQRSSSCWRLNARRSLEELTANTLLFGGNLAAAKYPSIRVAAHVGALTASRTLAGAFSMEGLELPVSRIHDGRPMRRSMFWKRGSDNWGLAILKLANNTPRHGRETAHWGNRRVSKLLDAQRTAAAEQSVPVLPLPPRVFGNWGTAVPTSAGC